jgi:transposase-like protein
MDRKSKYSKKFKLSVIKEYTADKCSITYALVYKWTKAHTS